MSSNKVTQKGNKGNDFAGRDFHKEEHYHNVKKTSISHLLDQFENEKNDDSTDDYPLLDELAQFKKRNDSDIRGLDKKLEVSSLNESFRLNAKFAKEQYVKNLESHIHSQSAQKIHIHFLSDAHYRFQYLVKPKLKDINESEILELIHDKITMHIMDKLERNYLDFNELAAVGTIFFLTGNCHINWDLE